MPFSHHSHSGQFCGHATSTLEAVVQRALAKAMTSLCLTEHIPRDRIDFYPEEEKDHDEVSLVKLFDDYYAEARRLQRAYKGRLAIFVGFETEWIREPRSGEIIRDLMAKYAFDLFVGSVHHVRGLPIDYDTTMYRQARTRCGGRDEDVFHEYFDAQLGMLRALKPPVVGHFDLIRLKSDEPNRSLRSYGDGLWEKVMRSLRFVASYGGVLEVNSSALRKGLKEAYPSLEICKECTAMGGRLTLSDDSHGVEQVGLNYGRAVEGLKEAGVERVWFLAEGETEDERFEGVRWKAVKMEELEGHAFWKKS